MEKKNTEEDLELVIVENTSETSEDNPCIWMDPELVEDFLKDFQKKNEKPN